MNSLLENIAWLLSLGLSIAAICITVRLVAQSRYNEHLERGKDFLKENRKENAIDEFNRCITIFPKNPEGYIARGEAYFLNGLHEDALDDYKRALNLTPEGPVKDSIKNRIEAINKGFQILEAMTK